MEDPHTSEEDYGCIDLGYDEDEDDGMPNLVANFYPNRCFGDKGDVEDITEGSHLFL